jgi:hypothetical protein
MSFNERTKRGIILIVAVLAGLTSFWLAALFLLIGALLIAWGQEPKRLEGFFANLPFGDHLLKAMTQVDLLLSSRDTEK